MRLAEYMASQQPGAKASDFAPLTLAHISQFEFGQEYRVALLNEGREAPIIPDAETMFEIIRTEFENDQSRVPMIEIKSLVKFRRPIINKKGAVLLAGAEPDTAGTADSRVLCVVPVLPAGGGFLPPLGLDHILEMLKRAVTMYNLTQSWDAFAKDNL